MSIDGSKIDAFLAAKKTLDGVVQWQPGNRIDERRALWVVLVAGKAVGATLQISAYPESSERPFTVGLFWPDCVWRLDYDPAHRKHRNPICDVQRRGLEPIVSGPHYHAWDDNRHLAKGHRVRELPCARALTKKMTWASAIRWFCGQTNVRMERHQMIDFPPRERLL